MRPNSFFSRHTLLGILGITSLTLGVMSDGVASTPTDRVNNVVLVHGGFVDGGGWEPVYKLLKAKGYNVSIVQNPTTSLVADLCRDQGRDRLTKRPRGSGSAIRMAAW